MNIMRTATNDVEERSDRLAAELVNVSEQSLRVLAKVLDAPIDPDNAPMIRAQVAAAGIVLATQIKADAMAMRRAQTDKALNALLDVIKAQEYRVPKGADFSIQSNGLLG